MATNGSASGSGSNNPNDRPRLTEDQKKQNHIVSEQKRRQAIRAGFDRLASIVPGMEGQGRSEAVVLQATVNEIHRQLALQQQLAAQAIETGTFDNKDLEQIYKPDDPGQGSGRGSQGGSGAPSPASGKGKGAMG